MLLKDIIKQTFTNLDQKNISPTPTEYAKEFYYVASKENFPIRDFDKLFAIVKIIQKSVEPNLSRDDTTGLVNLIVELNNHPENIFDDDVQKKIEIFLKHKAEVDTKELELKTQKFTMLVKYIANFITDAVNTNNSGNEKIKDFIQELESEDTVDTKHIEKLHSKLINIAKNINQTMDKTNDKLSQGKDSISKLQSEVEKLKQELMDAKKESEIDHLTGIPTRRTFDKQVKIFEANYQQNNVDYAVVFYDIDFFKKVNDTYGHDAGDFILNTFAKVLDSSTRKTDMIARYGGEEFIAVVRYEKVEELVKYTKRIKAIVKNYTFKYKDIRVDITFSAGVCFRNEANTLEETITLADEQLYKAKHSGRDRIIFKNNTII